MNKACALKKLIQNPELSFILEAHNGLSAKIVEEAGFAGIWASGLSISAALGVRDNNEASWTQVLDVVEFMSDATSIPILLDGDTGYGNFNNMRRLVKKLEQRSIAGVCIEDKIFPKTNSFIGGENQPLADCDEFVGKIKAGRDAQSDDSFVIVARTESFIAGWGLGEALRRAEAYHQAGADAILVHSKRNNPSEIEQFVAEWGNRLPIIIVPTKYYSTPSDLYRQLKISVVIWANHNLRASVSAQQAVSKRIFEAQSIAAVEEEIASVSEVFRLQGDEELRAAETLYLPTAGKKVRAIVLAAAQGDLLGDLTKEIPKALLKVHGRSLLQHIIEHCNSQGIKDISIVRGFAKEKMAFTNVNFIDNDKHGSTKELFSLHLAEQQLTDLTIISYGDIYFKRFVLHELLNDENDVAIVADPDFDESDEYNEYISSNIPFSRESLHETVYLKDVSPSLPIEQVTGEFIGLLKLSASAAKETRSILERMRQDGTLETARMRELLRSLNEKYRVVVHFIKGAWVDIDTAAKLHRAQEI